MTQTTNPVDPVFAGIAKALYGDVDPRELLAKFAPGGSDLHIDKPMDEKEARRQKRVAQTGLAATGVAGVAGVDATRAALKEGKHRVAEGGAGRSVGPVARQLVRMKMSPKAAGLAVGTGLLGLHAVELGADALGIHAQTKALKQANGSIQKQPVAKAFRLKSLNTATSKTPSLRARRPAANPLPKTPTAQGALFKSGPVVIVAKAGKHSIDPPGPVDFSNSASGMGQGSLVGALPDPQPGGKHRAQPTPKLKPVAPAAPVTPPPPPPGATPPPKASYGGAKWEAKTPGADASKTGEKIGAKLAGGLKAATDVKGLKPLGLIAGAAGAGAGVSSFLHRDKVNKGIVGNVRRTVSNAEKATGNANRAAASHADAAQKINDLIPSRKTVKRVAYGAAAAGSFGVGGAYSAGRASGRKQQRRRDARRAALVPYQTDEVGKSVTWTGEIAKVDADKRQVFGWASVSAIGGKPVVDLQGDIVPIEEVEKSAYRYVVESRKGGDMHRRVYKSGDQPLHTSDLIESFVVTGEKLEKMNLAADALPHGWWVGFKVNDDAQWDLVKSGHRAGFSIHGKGVRTPAGVSKSLDDVKDKATKKLRQVKGSLKTRTDQALHPPSVKLKPVRSSAVSEMGYQPQTRRLSYQMRSNPGARYTYKVPVTEGVSALSAESKGRHFATKVARKAKRSDSVSPAGRARLFLKPDVSKALGETDAAKNRRLKLVHRIKSLDAPSQHHAAPASEIEPEEKGRP